MLTKINKSKLAMLIAPIVSMFILTIGNGFFTTLTTIQLEHFKSPLWEIGVISSAYFAGIFAASYWSQRFTIRVGHIRAYAAFASLVAVFSLLQGLTSHPVIWFVSRFICGYCVTGLFIVIESWCLEGSSTANKGRIFAFYMFSYYFAQALGQLLLKIHFDPIAVAFCVIAGTASISVVPVCVTKFTAPKLSLPTVSSPLIYFKKVPLGILGSLSSGFILSGIYALLPLSLLHLGFSTSKLAYLMGLTILGGALFQFPIGKISDHVDRRSVLLSTCLFVMTISAILLFFHHQMWRVVVLVFMLGGGAFVIYPLSISHATDYTEKADTIAVLSAISLFFGVGSTCGPIVASNVIKFFGPLSLFSLVGLVCFLLAIYTGWRIKKRASVAEEDRAHFVPAIQEIVVGAETVFDNELNRPVNTN